MRRKSRGEAVEVLTGMVDRGEHDEAPDSTVSFGTRFSGGIGSSD